MEMGIDDPLVQEIPIKISGCPNGCAQHHQIVDPLCLGAFLGQSIAFSNGLHQAHRQKFYPGDALRSFGRKHESGIVAFIFVVTLGRFAKIKVAEGSQVQP